MQVREKARGGATMPNEIGAVPATAANGGSGGGLHLLRLHSHRAHHPVRALDRAVARQLLLRVVEHLGSRGESGALLARELLRPAVLHRRGSRRRRRWGSEAGATLAARGGGGDRSVPDLVPGIWRQEPGEHGFRLGAGGPHREEVLAHLPEQRARGRSVPEQAGGHLLLLLMVVAVEEIGFLFPVVERRRRRWVR